MSKTLALRFMNVGHFFDHFFLLVFPTAVLALHLEWGLGYADALALGTPSFVIFALATLPCGWLGDHWGGEEMMRVFFLGLGGSAVLTGLSSSPLGLTLGLAAIGLFAAIYHPVATAMVVKMADEPGRELGINGVWGNLGVALAAAITGGLAALWGWRAAFIIPGLLTMAVGVVYIYLGKLPAIETARARVGKAAAAIDPGEQRRVFIVVAITALMGGLTFNGITIALPKLFEDHLDAQLLGLAGIGAVTTAVLFVASFTQLFTGPLIDRVGAKPVMVLLCGLQPPLLVALALLPGVLVVPAAIPLMLGVFGIVPVSSWLLGRYVTEAWRSRAFALQFLLALGVNAAVVPLVAGLYGRTGSTAALLLVLAAAQLLVFAVAFLLPGRLAAIRGAFQPSAREIAAG